MKTMTRNLNPWRTAHQSLILPEKIANSIWLTVRRVLHLEEWDDKSKLIEWMIMYTMMRLKEVALQKDVKDLPLLKNLANLKRAMIAQVLKNLKRTVKKLKGEELRNKRGKRRKLLQSNSTNKSSDKWPLESAGKSKKYNRILQEWTLTWTKIHKSQTLLDFQIVISKMNSI